ncbi:MAG TPA: hypothetical protein VLT62_16890 [Candidatus Methylomirabilis sp.]|nr:hypothetical protein [Candidatus Methylomirabilis sp.]
MKRSLGVVLAVVSAISLTVDIAPAQDRAEMMARLLRTNLASKKTEMMSKALLLTPAEGAAFWPVYKEYQVELAQHTEQLQALIKDYVQNYRTLDDAKARELMDKSLEVQEQRLSLLRKYAGNLAKVLPLKQVAKFYQVESQMLRLMDLQINMELPSLE